MKRYLFAVLLLVVVIGVFAFCMPQPLQKVANYPKDAQCEIFCKSTMLPSTNVGFGHIVCCSYQNLGDTLPLCKDVDGVSLRFCATEDDMQSLCHQLRLQIHSCQYLGNLVVACGYSPKVSGGIFVDGKKTNVQIAFCDGVVTVGYPLILGSY